MNASEHAPESLKIIILFFSHAFRMPLFVTRVGKLGTLGTP